MIKLQSPLSKADMGLLRRFPPAKRSSSGSWKASCSSSHSVGFLKEQCIHEGEEGNFAETLEGISCIKKLHAGELGESVGSIEFHGLSQ